MKIKEKINSSQAEETDYKRRSESNFEGKKKCVVLQNETTEKSKTAKRDLIKKIKIR